jgi:hypothetical protein
MNDTLNAATPEPDGFAIGGTRSATCRELTRVQVLLLIPALPAGSDLVYWRTPRNLASDRRRKPELDAVATLLREAAEKGMGQLFQRRRRVTVTSAMRGAPAEFPDADTAGGEPGVVTDYCFRKTA